MCIRIYIFNFKKNKKNKKKPSTKQNKKTKNAKETKEKRIYGKHIGTRGYRLRICFVYFELTWSSSEFLLVVHMNLI